IVIASDPSIHCCIRSNHPSSHPIQPSILSIVVASESTLSLAYPIHRPYS
uniref:Uncharacterized protein n=1 Tax=Caenorhabditis japonica TaxID=281687 RepID=A0A8R1I9J9_CAEJA